MSGLDGGIGKCADLDRSGNACRPEAASGEAVGIPHVLFRLGSQDFLIEAPFCKGVVRKGRVARLPFTPPCVLGVAGIRGEAVSVTDPRVLLGLTPEPDPAQGYLLIVSAAGLKAALWVDRVEDVIAVDPARVLRGDADFPGAPEGVGLGTWTVCEQSAYILDVKRYLEVTAVVRE